MSKVLSLILLLLPATAWSQLGIHLTRNDQLALQYSSRFRFTRERIPLVSVRLEEGLKAISFSASQGALITTAGDSDMALLVPPRQIWTIHLHQATPAKITYRVTVGRIPMKDQSRLKDKRILWIQRGFKVQTATVGGVFGVAGRVFDNRVAIVMLGRRGTWNKTLLLAEQLYRKFGISTELFPEMAKGPKGKLKIVDHHGAVIAHIGDLVTISPKANSMITIKNIAAGAYGRRNRTYRGQVNIVVDRHGKLAVVNIVSVEEMLRGIVPSEIYPNAHMEALKAQAITARGTLLAKIGTRHIADPYLLCASTHCQMYTGVARETRRTNRAIEATKGEVLFNQRGLVDSVFSSNCGGHTADNDVIWAHEKDPSLRGHLDADSWTAKRFSSGITAKNIRSWLSRRPNTYCRRSSFHRKGRFRWKVHLTAAEVSRRVAPFRELGRIKSINVEGRGISGRIKTIEIIGTKNRLHVRRELNIRRLFGLKSGMFIIDTTRDKGGWPKQFVFTGGGWGHGAGMCQMGAIGMAEGGHRYPAILKHYYLGAVIVKMY